MIRYWRASTYVLPPYKSTGAGGGGGGMLRCLTLRLIILLACHHGWGPFWTYWNACNIKWPWSRHRLTRYMHCPCFSQHSLSSPSWREVIWTFWASSSLKICTSGVRITGQFKYPFCPSHDRYKYVRRTFCQFLIRSAFVLPGSCPFLVRWCPFIGR